MNGLDSAEFEEALQPMIAKGISQNQIQTTFKKMDPCDEGEVTWNDFINFAIEVGNFIIFTVIDWQFHGFNHKRLAISSFSP